MTAFSLINLDSESKGFLKKFDEALTKNEKVNKLTELLTFQILSCINKREGFSKNNVIKHFNHYSELIKTNQVKEKSIFILISQIRNKLKSEKDEELITFLKSKIDEFKSFGNSLNNKSK
jgi:hypothetical protein